MVTLTLIRFSLAFLLSSAWHLIHDVNNRIVSQASSGSKIHDLSTVNDIHFVVLAFQIPQVFARLVSLVVPERMLNSCVV